MGLHQALERQEGSTGEKIQASLRADKEERARAKIGKAMNPAVADRFDRVEKSHKDAMQA